MKLPQNISDVSIVSCEYQYSHVPLGFCDISECELGNGDCFGLYWPIGQENKEPIMCEFLHDEGRLHPVFSSLERFIKCAELVDFEWFDASSQEFIDYSSPRSLFVEAKALQRPETLSESVQILQTLIKYFPEYTDANNLLAKSFRLENKNEEALLAAMQALISPPCFGLVDVHVIHQIQSFDGEAPRCKNNPLFIKRQAIDWNFGGKKTNDTYSIMLDAIAFYENENDFISASSLAQTYAQYISSETISFQERYGFNNIDFIARQKTIASHLPAGGRTLRLS